MSQESLMILGRISQATILLPFVIALIRRNSLSRNQEIVGLIVASSFLTELIGFLIVEFASNPVNLPVYNTFAFVLFIILNRLFARLLKKLIRRLYFDLFLALFLVFGIVNVIVNQPFWTFNSNFITAASFVYIVYVLGYFYSLIKASTYSRLEQNPMFWLSTGLLIYHSGTIILFLIINKIANNQDTLIIVSWAINSVLNIFMNVFLTLSLWIKDKG